MPYVHAGLARFGTIRHLRSEVSEVSTKQEVVVTDMRCSTEGERENDARTRASKERTVGPTDDRCRANPAGVVESEMFRLQFFSETTYSRP